MVPAVLTLIPQFVLVNNLGLNNTYWSCIFAVHRDGSDNIYSNFKNVYRGNTKGFV